jgi:ABC-type bacteriocin/lantibiotic exporter with double-glycine peptidase domain
MQKEDLEIVKKFKTGKMIALASDLFSALLLFYLYSVNNNDMFLYMGIFLIIVGAVFIYIMGRAEDKFIKEIQKNARDSR